MKKEHESKTLGELIQEGWIDVNLSLGGCKILKNGKDRILWDPKTRIIANRYKV